MLHLCWTYFPFLMVQATYFKLSSSSITTLSPCACQYNGHIYNLSSLAKKDGARFKNKSGHYEYGYNPCIPFVQGDTPECQNVAICYWSDDGQMHEGIGFQNDVYCQVNKGIVEFIFKQRGTRMGMISTVRLKCNQSKILIDAAEMIITKDKAEPILEVEHKCCCPDGCPANIPPTLSTPTSYPSTVSPFTLHPPFSSKTYTSSDISIVWIGVAAAIVFIVVYLISVGLCCLRRASTTGYPVIVRTQRPLLVRLLFSLNFDNSQRRATPSRQHEEEARPPDYGAVRGPLLIPPPSYDDDGDDVDEDSDEINANDDQTRREGVEHEENPSDLRDDLPFGVPEDGFTSPVQVSERKSK